MCKKIFIIKWISFCNDNASAGKFRDRKREREGGGGGDVGDTQKRPSIEIENCMVEYILRR